MLSDHHEVTLFYFALMFREYHQKLKYWNFKVIDGNNFLWDSDQELLEGEFHTGKNEMFSFFTNVFRSVLKEKKKSRRILDKRIK